MWVTANNNKERPRTVTRQYTIINGGGPGAYDVSSATSAAAHLGQDKHGHNLTKQRREAAA
jgi:hypothetical protein